MGSLTRVINLILSLLFVLIGASLFIIILLKLFGSSAYESTLNGIWAILLGVAVVIHAILYKTMNVKKYLQRSRIK